MKKTGLLISLSLLCCTRLFAQHNSDYIQYMFNGLLLNPAYAGVNEALDATLLYRNQWVGIDGAPTTISLGAHSALKNRHLNAGILLENETVGLYNRTKAVGAYAYRLKIKKGFFSMGVQAGVNSYSYNWNSLRVTSENDPSFASAGQRENLITAGAGLYYNNKHMYAGLSAPGFLEKNLGTLILTGGGLLPVSEAVKIKPAFILKYVQSTAPVVNLSATCYFREFLGIGAGYAIRNSAFLYMDVSINQQLRFGYGFAYPLSRLNMYSPGTHEVMVRYLFKYSVKATSPRYF